MIPDHPDHPADGPLWKIEVHLTTPELMWLGWALMGAFKQATDAKSPFGGRLMSLVEKVHEANEREYATRLTRERGRIVCIGCGGMELDLIGPANENYAPSFRCKNCGNSFSDSSTEAYEISTVSRLKSKTNAYETFRIDPLISALEKILDTEEPAARKIALAALEEAAKAKT